jgi:hypothetical protein
MKEKINLDYGYNKEKDYLCLTLKNSNHTATYVAEVFGYESKIKIHYYNGLIGYFNYRIGKGYSVYNVKTMRLEQDLSLFEEINKAFFPFLYGLEKSGAVKQRIQWKKNLEKSSHECLISDNLKEVIGYLKEASREKNKEKRFGIQCKIQNEIDKLFIELISINLGKFTRESKIIKKRNEINSEIIKFIEEKELMEELLMK